MVPRLRFPFFNDQWIIKRLDELAKIERGKFSPRPRNNPIYYDGHIPFVQTSDVVKSKGRINSFSQTLNDSGLAVSKLFKKGSILITIAANIGYSGVLEKDMACPDSLIGMTCFENIYNFFLQLLLEIEQPRMDNLATAAAQKNINIDFLKPYKLIIPGLVEQQKIASFLSSVDKKISHLEKKKTLLETYKRGIMQKIFSQELRFKDENGQEFPDWERVRIDSVSECLDNKRKPLNSNQRSKMQGDIPYYGANGVVDYVNDFIFNEDLVLLAEDGGHFDEFLTRPIAQIISGKSWVNNHAHILRANSLISIDFLYYSLVHKDIRKYIVGGGRAKLNKSDLLSIIISLPKLNEQKKIASFLSSIDKKIEITSTQLEMTREFKKGLLQQMFV